MIVGACALAPVLLISACGRIADIELRTGREVHGEIRGSDRDALYVRTTRSDVRISRSDIAGIHHPGDTTRWIGAGLFAIGATLAVAGAVELNRPTKPGGFLANFGKSFGGIFLLGLGLEVGTSGLIVGLTSLQRGAQSREAAATPAK